MRILAAAYGMAKFGHAVLSAAGAADYDSEKR